MQQRLIRSENFEIGVVRQNQVLNRIEGVYPLPLRTQHLLGELQILSGDAQFLRRRFEKLKLFAAILPAARAAECDHANRRFLAHHRHEHNLPNAAVFQQTPRFRRHREGLDRSCTIFMQRLCQGVVHSGLPHRAKNLGREPYMLHRYEMRAFQSMEPRRFCLNRSRQLAKSGLHNGGMTLPARDRGRQLGKCCLPPRTHSRFVQHHQQHARAKKNFRQQVAFRRNAARKGMPVEIERHQTSAKQDRARPDSSQPREDELECDARGQCAARNI